MALVSPGIQVTVIDESFYTPAEPGTTPLIVIATAQDKPNAAATATAAGTTKANTSRAFRITSQRELVETFGVPFFEKTASSTPIHGSERNEYGLLAAYSLLGVTNSVFITRADINLDELEAQSAAPGSEPRNGQWWLNTVATNFGIQEWNGASPSTPGGQKFSYKVPLVLTDSDQAKTADGKPKTSVGIVGDYAVVAQTVLGAGTFDATRENITYWYKSAGGTIASGAGIDPGSWVKIGSPDWKASHPAVIGTTAATGGSGVGININGTPIQLAETNGTFVVNEINNLMNSQGISARLINGRVAIFSDGTDSSTSDSTDLGVVEISGDAGTLAAIGITTGQYFPPALQISTHTVVPRWKGSAPSADLENSKPRPTGSVWLKTTQPNSGARFIISRWSSDLKVWTQVDAPLYSSTTQALYFLNRTGGGLGIDINSLFVQTNVSENSLLPEADLRLWRRANAGPTKIISDVAVENSTFVNGTSYSFTISESLAGSIELDSAKEISFMGTGIAAVNAERFADAIAGAGLTNIEVSINGINKIEISHKLSGDFKIVDGTNDPIAKLFSTGTKNLYSTAYEGELLATNWEPLSGSPFKAQGTGPLEEPKDGQLWYNPNFSEVDLMVHNGDVWVGFNNHPDYLNAEVIVAASEPELSNEQRSIDNHVWISTADLDNFPTIYRWNVAESEWNLIDKTDQTTEDGILFADARYNTNGADSNVAGSLEELKLSNYVDPDCPDPALYPRGMLLWNLRRSGGNVKRYANNYIDPTLNNIRYESTRNDNGLAPFTGDLMADYATDRWVTASANNEDGSGAFGRKAQRKVIVSAMKSVIDTSEEIRDEERRNFNIIAAPGYPELLSNLINLNIDRGLTAFVIGDTPLRLKSDATTLTNWGTNANLVFDNGDDGIVSYDEYCAVYYPNGFTTDLSGTNAVVPSSHMMLRTIALSDQVSYPWFAPAGTRRGGITNATAVGYIDAATGEFQTVALNEGQRDTLYELKVNPIPFFVGVGHVAYGQKTRARNASALDRINVARLVVYLRSQLNKLARPYVFEPNDKITRDEIRGAVESLLLELVGLRAIYDFAVVCDESNNTPARIDRNELWVDVAIEPVKAVEFIYIPLRLKNTGEI